MGDILGLGVTHYPGLAAQGNLCRRIKICLADPALPERLRELTIGPNRCASSGAMTKGRPFRRPSPGDDRRFSHGAAGARTNSSPIFASSGAMINSRTIKPTACRRFRCSRMIKSKSFLARQSARRQFLERTQGKGFTIHGHRDGAKHLASFLLDHGFDIPYAINRCITAWAMLFPTRFCFSTGTARVSVTRWCHLPLTPMGAI